jgi:pyrroloquinoline-quinone synthase
VITTATFRDEMLAVVEARHCKRHPLTEAWAKGELSQLQLGAWAVEHWHFTHDLYAFIGRIIANCDVSAGRAMEMENVREEEDPSDPHNSQLLDFVEACGVDSRSAITRPPLPSTRALRDWLYVLTDQRSWQEAVAGLHIGLESQLPQICDRIVPTLRDHYGFEERAIRFFVTHQTADVEHGGRALQIVEDHTPPELRPRVLQAIDEGTERRWFYFDGVYVKQVIGYNLGNQQA